MLAGGQWWLTQLGTDTTLGVVVAMHVVFCIGMAVLMTPLMTASVSGVQTAFVVGGCIALVAIVPAPLVRRLEDRSTLEPVDV